MISLRAVMKLLLVNPWKSKRLAENFKGGSMAQNTLPCTNRAGRLIGQSQPLNQCGVSGIAAEWLEPRLHIEVDERRLAFGAGLLEQSKRRVAIAESRMREREVIARHVHGAQFGFELRDERARFLSRAGKRLGVRKPRQRNRIVVAMTCGSRELDHRLVLPSRAKQRDAEQA